MNPMELAKLCKSSIEFHDQHGSSIHDARITIVLPKRWKPPPKFPRRELLSVNNRGERIYSLSAVNVLAWLVANKLVQVQCETRKQ